MKRRSNKTLAIYLIAIWVVAAFLLESSDLWISINLFNPDCTWAIFLEKYGEIPGLLVALIGVHIYIVTVKTSSNIKSILFSGFLLTTGSLVTLYIFWLLSLAFSNSTVLFSRNQIYFFLGAILANIAMSLLFRKKYKFSKKSILFSRISFKMFFYGHLIFVSLLKIIWGRIRFRDLAENYSNFTPWYLPNGINGNQSFPSGHAAMGFMLLALFVFVTDKAIYKRVILKGIILTWSIAVCLSRVIIGAHFSSDVLFGSFIMIVTYFLIINKSNKSLQPESN